MAPTITKAANSSPMQGELLSSESFQEDRKAAQNTGCLSVFLFPPFSAFFFGALLFWGLIKLPFNSFIDRDQVQLAPLFTPEVLKLETQILAWASEYGMDANLVATVMQIESCGNPRALSPVGAMGLFQVMPYHFAKGEDGFAPNMNALRGLSYLQKSLEHFGGDTGLALAGYNGGIQGASHPANEWAEETRNYKYWGENIYADALAGFSNSATLQEWLAAGGASLCAQAEQRLAQAP